MSWKNFQDKDAVTEVSLYLIHKKRCLMADNTNIKLFKSTTTIAAVKKVYLELENPPEFNKNGGNKMTGMTWTGKKGVMKDGDTLAQHANKFGKVKVNITFKVNGGSNDEKIDYSVSKSKYNGPFFSFDHPSSKKNRKLDKDSGDDYPFSKDKDCITLEYHKENLKMDCGHTFNPNSIYKIMLNIFITTNYAYKILCPVPKCHKEWDFDDCAVYTNLNENEYNEFETEIISRANPSKPCPHCKAPCSRPKNLQYFRVACQCAKGDWCYECGQTWKGGGFTVCGNEDCDLNDINDILSNCGTEHNVYSVKVPKLRACPKCFTIIEHTQACKHMHCKGCGNHFCFICLKNATLNDKGQVKDWNCKTGNSSSSDCGVAPIQKIK